MTSAGMADLAGRPLWHLVERRAALTPDALFALDERDRALTFAELRQHAEAAAAGLQHRGVTTGTVVSWQLPTWFDSIVLTLALARLGAVQNPILPIYREREVGFAVAQTRARVLIVPDRWRGTDYAAIARRSIEAGGDLPTEIIEIGHDGFGGLPTGDPDALPPAPAGTGDPVRWIYYTSGTTADPKGALHTDATIAAGSLTMTERLRVVAADRIGLVFPYAHIGGSNFLFASLWSGCSLLCVEAFDPATSIPALHRQGVTLAGAGTVFHLAYLAARRADPTGTLLSQVRAFPGGAAPKPVTLHAEMKAAFDGAGIVSGYGLTEAPAVAMGSLDDPDGKLATTEGRASIGVDLRVVDPVGVPCPPGVEGELRVKGPMVCKGYLDSALTAAAFDDDGYFCTGDLGTVDEAGYVAVTGRLKDVIIRKGENISAKEVEDLIFALPEVLDVAVIGLPDDARGERCCAVVVLHDGAELDLAGLAGRLRSAGLMPQKLPEQLEVVAALPRNAAGKVQKRDLRDHYRASCS